MANTSKVCGLRPINQPYGSIRANYYQATTSTAFFMYQPVDLDANGRVVVATPGSNNFIVGSIIGVFDDAFCPIDNAYSGYVPANNAATNSAGLINILVADDPNQFFLIEEDTGGTALDAQSAHAGCSWTYQATTGNTVSGIARAVMDRSTLVAGGSGQQLRIIKKWDKPDNAYGDYCKWIVKPYYHRYNPPNQETAAATTV